MAIRIQINSRKWTLSAAVQVLPPGHWRLRLRLQLQQQWTKIANEGDSSASRRQRLCVSAMAKLECVDYFLRRHDVYSDERFGGDPYPGQLKEVDVLAAAPVLAGSTPPPPPPATQQWTKVANEGDLVNVPAGTTVRFGYAPNWSVSITFSAATTFTATNSFFGGDPYPNQFKEVDALGSGDGITTGALPSPPPATQQWTKVANEGDLVSVPAGTTVRFGYDPNWSASITFSVATTFTATNSYFGGDPYPNQFKEVDALGTGAGITTGSAP